MLGILSPLMILLMYFLDKVVFVLLRLSAGITTQITAVQAAQQRDSNPQFFLLQVSIELPPFMCTITAVQLRSHPNLFIQTMLFLLPSDAEVISRSVEFEMERTRI